ncbi:MAG TPA: thioesterase family protein [Streptosporangiaceae bacterium]
MHSVFFEPAGTGTYVATAATAGPWSPQAQHGGPPSALAARAIESHEPDPRQRLSRVTVDILRPVPVGKVSLRVRTVRPGRRVALLEAVMEADGQEVLHARGWRITRPAGEVPAIGTGGTPPPIPPQGRAPDFRRAHTDGYLSAIEWRFVTGGGFREYAEGSAWTRPRIPLLPGEHASPMSRALLVADSGSGVAAALDPGKFQYINVDLTVVLPRDPAGDWLLLDSATTIGSDGTGLAQTSLSDTGGWCGRAMQTLLVAPLAGG